MICNISVALVWYIVSKWTINNLLEPWKTRKNMKNHSRYTPFPMCVVALFFVLAWWRVYMTNSLPAKTARKLQASKSHFLKQPPFWNPSVGNWGDFNLVSRSCGLWPGTRPNEKQKQSKKTPHWCESFVSGRQDGWNSTLHFVDENVYILRKGQDRRQERISFHGTELGVTGASPGRRTADHGCHKYSRIFPMGRGRKLFTHWSGDLRTNFAIVRFCSCASGSPLIWYYTSAPGKIRKRFGEM